MQQSIDARPIRYNIAMLAPPWIPVPPDGYGGTEQVVALLCEGLVGLGHRVHPVRSARIALFRHPL